MFKGLYYVIGGKVDIRFFGEGDVLFRMLNLVRI